MTLLTFSIGVRAILYFGSQIEWGNTIFSWNTCFRKVPSITKESTFGRSLPLLSFKTTKDYKKGENLSTTSD